MSHSRFLIAFSLVSAVTAAGSPLLFQDAGTFPAVGFARDCDYAKRLATRGMRVQAEWVVKRLGTNASLNDEQKLQLQYVSATVAISSFEAEKDFDKAKGLYDGAKKSLDAFIGSGAKGTLVDEARYEAGDLDRKMGEKVIQQIKVETSAEKIGDLRKLGETAFTNAINYFRDRVDKVAADIRAKGAEPVTSPAWIAASFAIPNTYLSWAFLYPPGDAKRTDSLKRASSNFEEFTLNVSNETFVYYEAAIKWANAKRELEEKDADDVYNLAVDLAYFIDPDTNQKTVKEPAELLDADRFIILNAATEVARLYILKQRYDDLLAMYADIRKAIPKLNEYERGVELMLEVARCYDAQGKKELAKAEAKKVAQVAPPGSALWNSVRELQARLGEDLTKVSDLTENEVYGTIVGFTKEGKLNEAVRAFHEMLGRVRGTPAEKKFAAGLLAYGGNAYRVSGKPLEAIVCWKRVGEAYPDNKTYAPQSLFSAVQAACQVWTTTKSEWAGELAQEAVEKLQAAYPDLEVTTEAQQLKYATEAKVGGKPPLELAKVYEEQLKTLQKGDAKFGRITYEAGKKYFDAGRGTKNKAERDQARTGLERNWELYLDWAKAQNTLDETEKQRTDERVSFVQLSRAQAWLWEPGANVERTFALLKELEDRMTKSPSAKARAVEIEQVKLRAFLQQGQLEKAVSVVEGMLTKAPDNTRTIASVERIARTVWQDLKANFGKLPPDKANQLMDWTLRYMREWINAGSKVGNLLDSSDYEFAAVSLFTLGLYRNGFPPTWPGSCYSFLESGKFVNREATDLAAAFFSKAIEAHASGNPDFIVRAKIRRGACYGLLQRWKELADDYRAVLHEAGALTPNANGAGLTLVATQGLPKPETIALDCAYALAELAKRGDKKAGDEAQQIAAAVVVYSEPKGNAEPSFEFWFGRYIAVMAADANADRKMVQDRITYYKTTDKDLDKDKWGFRKKILDIEAKNK